MVKVEVTKLFMLKDFDKLRKIVRKGISEEGTLFEGDTFECDEEMFKYLSGENDYKKSYVKRIDIPKVEKEEKVEEVIKVEKPKDKKLK